MVSQQIVQVVAPLRSAKNGDYTLSLQLHPADLGAVTVRVEVQQGVLSVHMSAEHAHGHDALNQSLADLRTQLQSNGVRTGDIVVAAKPSVAPQHQDPQHRNQHQQDQHQHTGGRHPQEAPMRNDTGAARRPGDRSSHHAPSQADDDALDVRI
jgi:flagellar hook-length control protein FliK